MFLSESLPDVSAQRRVSLPRWPPGGPPEPPGRVTSGGPSLGAAVGAGAAPRAWATSGHTEGAEREDATRWWGGQAQRDGTLTRVPGPAGRGGGGVGAASVPKPWTVGVREGSPCVWVYFSCSHL